MHLMVVAGLVAAFNPSVTPLSHHPEMRRGSGAVATIALGKPDEPLVSVPPPALIAANPPDPALGEARLSSFLGMPTLYPSIALAAAFVSIAVHLLSQVAGFNGLKLIVAGAIAGVISRTACAPIEMVATLMMCSGGDSKGMLPELKDAWRKDGMRGLFKGNGANCLKVAPQRGTQFLVYESAKRMLAENGWFGIVAGAPLPAGARLLAGGIAGMCAAVIVYPLEVIKTLRTVYPEQCTGIDETFRCVMKFGGIRSFYAGLTPTLFAMFPYVGFEFMVYETLKKHVMASTGLTQISVVAQLCIGALAGAAGQASAHPLDVVRRRMQMAFLQKKGMVKAKVGDEKKVPITNMIQGLYSIGKYEGLPMLFRGLGPACLEKVPSTAIGYVIYEAMKATLGVA